MNIYILTDNFPGNKLQPEHGLSYLIEFEGKRLLFDTGQSNLFLKNAIKTKQTLREIIKMFNN